MNLFFSIAIPQQTVFYLDRYLYFRTICPQGYHPPSSQCFGSIHASAVDYLSSRVSFAQQSVHWLDPCFCCGLLVREGIIRRVVSNSALTWFIRNIYYLNLQLNNVIINKINIILSSAQVTLMDFDCPVGDISGF